MRGRDRSGPDPRERAATRRRASSTTGADPRGATPAALVRYPVGAPYSSIFESSSLCRSTCVAQYSLCSSAFIQSGERLSEAM